MVKQTLVLNDQAELGTLQGMGSFSMFRLVMPTNEEAGLGTMELRITNFIVKF